MNTLRRPFLFAAFVLIALCILVELGIGSLLSDAQAVKSQVDAAAVEAKSPLSANDRAQAINETDVTDKSNAGLAIRYLALLDGIVVLTVAFMISGLYFPESIHARIQAVVSCFGSCFVILLGIVFIILAILLLFFMVGLFLAAPFGTIAYLAIFGSFDKSGAAVTLGLLMLLKLGFVACLLLANQAFIVSKPLVALIVTSLVANIIVSFLHGLPPGFLVSITDSIAAIVIGIIAVIWAIIVLVGAISAIVRSLKVA
jgi:hypothetical protein